jgi:hypothetical protein
MGIMIKPFLPDPKIGKKPEVTLKRKLHADSPEELKERVKDVGSWCLYLTYHKLILLLRDASSFSSPRARTGPDVPPVCLLSQNIMAVSAYRGNLILETETYKFIVEDCPAKIYCVYLDNIEINGSLTIDSYNSGKQREFYDPVMLKSQDPFYSNNALPTATALQAYYVNKELRFQEVALPILDETWADCGTHDLYDFIYSKVSLSDLSAVIVQSIVPYHAVIYAKGYLFADWAVMGRELDVINVQGQKGARWMVDAKGVWFKITYAPWFLAGRDAFRAFRNHDDILGELWELPGNQPEWWITKKLSGHVEMTRPMVREMIPCTAGSLLWCATRYPHPQLSWNGTFMLERIENFEPAEYEEEAYRSFIINIDHVLD